MASWSAWAAASRCRLTSGWCAPPTLTCRRWSRKVIFAPTCSTAWPSTWYSSPAARPAERHHVARQPVCTSRCAAELGLPLFPGFSERATATLLGYRWPGNIRELKNVVERSVYRHGDSEHELDAIIINPFRQSPGSPPEAAPGDELPALPLDLRDFQLQQEKRLLERSLEQAKYHQKQAAELLGLTYHQLRALLKKHQL